MKDPVPSKPAVAAEPRRPTPRVAAARHITADRPLRVWSLLLRPSIGPK
jgi:hypothetical protein